MTAFDAIAPRYGALWSEAPQGRAQREAAWRAIDPLFGRGDRILDLGCGTGDDAVHLLGRGVEVLGVDKSAEMVRIARERGVDARVLALENLSALQGRFDGAISNFGALNCVEALRPLARELGRLIVPGGSLVLGVFGNFCLWETAWYLRRADLPRAARRLRGAGVSGSLGVRVWYPDRRALTSAFAPEFRLMRWIGLGFAIPPSYVGLSETLVRRLAAIDGHVAHWPAIRAMSDHRLYILRRV